MYASINGELVEDARASVPLGDWGFLHGACVFTTMRSEDGRIFRLARHLSRVRSSCAWLGIALAATDAQLTAWIAALVAANAIPAARVRLSVTRGVPGSAANTFITAAPLQAHDPALSLQGARVAWVEPYRLNPDEFTAGHKTADYVGRLAALSDARARGMNEAIWLDTSDRVQCGCVSNLFIIKGGLLRTPPTTADLKNASAMESRRASRSAVLPGITRQAVLDISPLVSLPVQISPIDTRELMNAEECFLTNSIIGVMPVSHVSDTPIGDGRPGPFTGRLIAEYENRLRTGE